MSTVELKNINKTYYDEVSVKVLHGVDLKVNEGEFVAIMGPSGSGKSTLLNIIATLDKPTSGELLFNGQDALITDKNKLAEFRRKNLGFVFQKFNLLEPLTVIENIMLPLTLERISTKKAQNRAIKLLTQLNILQLKNKRIYQLSGGEAQRVAICRALIHRPSLLLADEPTGSLDSKAANDVLDILSTINKQEKVTTLMVTHDAYAASFCSKVIFIKDGVFYDSLVSENNQTEFHKNILRVLSELGGKNNDVF